VAHAWQIAPCLDSISAPQQRQFTDFASTESVDSPFMM